MDRHTAEPSVEDFPGDRAAAWVDHQQSVAAPSTHLYDFVWDHTADAVGPFCRDVDGNVLMDFTSHVASAPLGYNNPKLVERLEGFDLVDPTKIAGQDFYVGGDWPPDDPDLPGPAGLMHRLTDLLEGYDMDTVFLSNSGAEAVENAIKVCYDYRPGATRGVVFEGAFHGRTLGALSLNRSKAVHRRGFPELSGITAVPYCDDRACTPGTCRCGFFPDGDPSRLRRLFDPERGTVDPDEVAYVIVEPIQGEGGYRVPSDAFMDELHALAVEHDVPLIADEVQTGLGRTGEWWGADHFAIEPDVVASAKALRVGATVGPDRVFPDETARLSSTWGAGDVLATLQGAATIDAIREHDLLSNARARGEQFLDRVHEADPDHVVDARGRGLLLALEFDTKARRDAVMECCLKRRGLMTLPCGYKTLRLLPPLDATEREIDLAADLLLDAIGDREVRDAEPRVPTGDDVS